MVSPVGSATPVRSSNKKTYKIGHSGYENARGGYEAFLFASAPPIF